MLESDDNFGQILKMQKKDAPRYPSSKSSKRRRQIKSQIGIRGSANPTTRLATPSSSIGIGPEMLSSQNSESIRRQINSQQMNRGAAVAVGMMQSGGGT